MDSADYAFFGGAALFALGFIAIFAPITAWLNKLGGPSKSVRPTTPKPPDSLPKS